MTHLQIETQSHDGYSCIEMRPPLDEVSKDIVHELGIIGISQITEREDKYGESMSFEFTSLDNDKLDRDANMIAEALNQVGTTISFYEKPVADLIPTPLHARRWGGLALRPKQRAA